MTLVAIAGLSTFDGMAWGIFLSIWIVLAWSLNRRPQPSGRRRTQGERKSAADPRDDSDYDGYYDDVDIILRTRGIRPPGNWRRATSDWFQVAGVMHHASSSEDFIRGVQAAHDEDREFGLHLVREPDNPYDSSAVAVHGWWDSGATEPRSVKIGYLPREVAAKAKRTSKLAGELESVWLKPIDNERDGLSVRMYLLEPAR
jgi:hypothetical protein